jgi:localization factor PodJL
VKGIEPEAREAAKQAARRAGVTLGAWLNQVIMDGGTDEVGQPDASASLRAGGETQSTADRSSFTSPSHTAPAPRGTEGFAGERIAIDMEPVAEAVRGIVSRVEQSERRTQDLARRMEQSVGMLSERLEQSERSVDHAANDARVLDPLERKIQQLAERLEDAERGRGSLGRRGSDDRAQLQTLEKAVNAVVDHLETAERRTDESLSEIRRTLSEIAERVDEHEEEDAREEAEARARAAEEHMQMLAARLEKMESSVANVGGSAVDAALKAIAEKDDAERHKSTISDLQAHLSDITQRLERAEKRTDETLKTFELTVTGIAKRLEEIDSTRGQNVTQEIDLRTQELNVRLEEMAARLRQSEEMTVSTAQSIERAIAGMSDSMNSAEDRSRETIDSLNVMLERMTDRLGRIERETKATRSSIKQTVGSTSLSPQVNVGQQPSAGSGFVPSGQAFPIPNFDAPSIGGGYGPVSEFRSPEAGDPFRAPPLAPMPAPQADDQISDMPPPFAPSPDGERLEPRLDTPRSVEEDDGLLDDEAEVAPAIDEPAKAANDFMAAARRAAQAAAQNGRGGPQPMMGPNGYGDPTSPRYAAMQEGEGRTKKLIFAAIAAVLVAIVAVGAFRMLSSEPVIVSTTAPDTTNKAASLAPADMDANTQTTKAGDLATTVPAGPSDPDAATPSKTVPEATPEDAKAAAQAAASASATPALPVAKPAKPAHAVTSTGPAIKPGPSITPAPSKPVASAPLGDVTSSERALRAAAVSGNPAAQYEVGQRYANGDNVPQDLAQAAYWYNQAADQGLAIAQYRLATLYEKGRGVAKDDAKARVWYEKAATKGNVKAMHNLAVIYAEGRGARQDFTTAARWFGDAADHGLGDSQYNLAILQERGLGVPQDLSLAYKWLAIAAKGGDKGAAQKLDEIAGKLSADKLAAAKASVASWSPKPSDPVANGDLSRMGNWGNSASNAISGGDTTASIQATPTRNDIGKAQAMLKKLGYDPGSSDGLMGPRTRDAILRYQRSANLEQSGNVNAALLKSLEIATR